MALTLKEARKQGKIDQFINEQEAAHKPVNPSVFQRLLNAMAKKPPKS